MSEHTDQEHPEVSDAGELQRRRAQEQAEAGKPGPGSDMEPETGEQGQNLVAPATGESVPEGELGGGAVSPPVRAGVTIHYDLKDGRTQEVFMEVEDAYALIDNLNRALPGRAVSPPETIAPDPRWQSLSFKHWVHVVLPEDRVLADAAQLLKVIYSLPLELKVTQLTVYGDRTMQLECETPQLTDSEPLRQIVKDAIEQDSLPAPVEVGEDQVAVAVTP